MVVTAIVLAWAAGNLVLLALFRRALLALWREPVLRFPVLIIESDDWGPGPEEQSAALRAVALRLARHRDDTGRRPVMTLGMVLAAPDVARMQAARWREYHRRDLQDGAYAPLRAAIAAGIAQGVFSVQLHGMEHYWPAALLAALAARGEVADWFPPDRPPQTERLPPHLQSRWVNAATLPAAEIPPDEIAAAVAEEVNMFAALYGGAPSVVVPPTFVWNRAVERAWAGHGVRVVVTPGRRYEGRAATGGLTAAGGPLLNGQRGAAGVMYLVRDDYFEPALGHRAERGVAALAAKTRLGRPTLLETHRANFIGGQGTAAVDELDRLLEAARSRCPRLRFLSTAELADAIARGDGALIERGSRARLRVWSRRARVLPRFERLARFSGLSLGLALLESLAGPGRRAAGY